MRSSDAHDVPFPQHNAMVQSVATGNLFVLLCREGLWSKHPVGGYTLNGGRPNSYSSVADFLSKELRFEYRVICDGDSRP
jgi:hypothetical protein